MTPPFPASEYRARVEKVRELMRHRGLDGLVLHGNRADRAAVRYLSNFEDIYGGDTLVLIPPTGEVGLATNAIMHSEPMHSGIQETWIRDARCAPRPRTVVTPTTSIFDRAEDILRDRGIARGGLGVAEEYAREALAALRQRVPEMVAGAMNCKKPARVGKNFCTHWYEDLPLAFCHLALPPGLAPGLHVKGFDKLAPWRAGPVLRQDFVGRR